MSSWFDLLITPHAVIGITSAQASAGINAVWICSNVTIAVWLRRTAMTSIDLPKVDRQVLRDLSVPPFMIALHRSFWNVAIWDGDGVSYAPWAFDYRSALWVLIAIALIFSIKVLRSVSRHRWCPSCWVVAICTALVVATSIMLTPVP